MKGRGPYRVGRLSTLSATLPSFAGQHRCSHPMTRSQRSPSRCAIRQRSLVLVRLDWSSQYLRPTIRINDRYVEPSEFGREKAATTIHVTQVRNLTAFRDSLVRTVACCSPCRANRYSRFLSGCENRIRLDTYTTAVKVATLLELNPLVVAKTNMMVLKIPCHATSLF